MERLKDRIAVVTGGASGNGRAICERYVEQGAVVIVADADSGGGMTAAQELGNRAHFQHVDVTDESSVEQLVASTVDGFGSIDILVNNAGIQEQLADLELQPLEAWSRVIAVNLTGVFLCMKHGLGQMRRQGSGVVINMGSGGAGINGAAGMPAYSASKAGVLILTKGGALEYAGDGIRVNCICPGVIDTPLLDRLIENMEENGIDGRRFLSELQPIKRLGTTAEIADVALFLASDESSLVNGTMLVADGGLLAGAGASTEPYRIAGT